MDQLRTVFYHHPCLDGSTAAWSAFQKWHENAQYVGLDHSDYETIEETIRTHVTPETIAIFLDFAPRKEILENIIDDVKGVEIYDHHISAQKGLQAFADHPKCHIVFDMHRSGAGMAYDIFSNNAGRPLFIELVEKLDLYKPSEFDSPDQFYLIAAALSTIDVDKPLDQMLPIINKYIKHEDIAWFEQQGEVPRNKYREKIDQVLQDVDMANLSILEAASNCIKIPTARARIDDMGHEFAPRLLSLCPHEHKVGFVWTMHNDDIVKLSLRSDGKVDVSLIAEEMGKRFGQNGGGHKGASAARFTREQFVKFAYEIGIPFNQGLKK